MGAVLVSEFGGPEQLQLGQAADPVAGPGQVRIAVLRLGLIRSMPVTGRTAAGPGCTCRASLAMTSPGSSIVWSPGSAAWRLVTG
jgi:NADPH:quinone reductase-like Zn-dependent oxidoreductase